MRFFSVETHILLKGVKRKERVLQHLIKRDDDDDDDIINKMNTINALQSIARGQNVRFGRRSRGTRVDRTGICVRGPSIANTHKNLSKRLSNRRPCIKARCGIQRDTVKLSLIHI